MFLIRRRAGALPAFSPSVAGTLLRRLTRIRKLVVQADHGVLDHLDGRSPRFSSHLLELRLYIRIKLDFHWGKLLSQHSVPPECRAMESGKRIAVSLDQWIGS